MKPHDLSDQRFGRWTVLCYAESRHARAYWRCRCECGNEKAVAAGSLTAGLSESCGCLHRERTAAARFIDLTGRCFNHLTVLRRADNRGIHPHWICRCDCGTEKTVSGSALRDGRTKSCGCFRQSESYRIQQRLASTKHGHHLNDCPTPEYTVWAGMKARCLNSKVEHFKYYGGRGIKICDRWNSFENFLVDMGSRPKGSSLDRIDVDGNYEPGNCRWATSREQAQNKQPLVTVSLPKKLEAHRVKMIGQYGNISCEYNDLNDAVQRAKKLREEFPTDKVTIELC